MSDVKRSVSPGTDTSKILKKIKRSSEPLDELSEFGPLTQEDVVYYQKEALYRMMNLYRSRNRRLGKGLKDLEDNYARIYRCYSILNTWWAEIVEHFKTHDKFEIKTDINEHVLVPVDESFEADTEKLKETRLALINLIQPLLSLPVSEHDDKLATLQESLAGLSVFKSQLEDENKLLRDKIEELNQELDVYIGHKDRAESKTLERISDVKKAEEPIVKEQTPEIKTENGEQKQESDANIVEFENLKVEVEELKTKNNVISQQLEEKMRLIQDLEARLSELSVKLLDPSEDDLQKSSLFQSLSAKNIELNTELSKVKYESSKTESQYMALESSITQNQSALEEKLRTEMKSNNGYIQKLETDLSRIRADRDELQAQISVLKAEKGKSELTEEYRKLNEVLEKRLEELEKSVNRDYEAEATSSEDIATLQKHNAILTMELKQMEEAFKQTRQIAQSKLQKYADSDSYINKLTVEKNKADQKYFQAMRSKDSLTSQNRILNSNLTKQNELIEVLKGNEKNLMKKFEIEQQLYEKLKNLEIVFKNDLNFQVNKNKELELKLKSATQMNQELQAKLNQKNETSAEQQRRISGLEAETKGLSSKVKSLESLLMKYRANNPSATAEDEEINQALLAMTKCQLCNKNFKNLTLKVCGHCFCADCINDRLSSRMRKCPNCNQQFSSYDVLTIHL
ncbi:hypothetical protein KL928_004293 [Ogataea angusta]|uniref:E3 ubiquitin protein ligase n=1 Tax=Pichia angusta TaxID=870730 RepID=A0AAN6DCC3_PICAN|nr:uncharacterized protein KL928_004293 [Ogataea angusta]KAG7816829.1 hypothetical protein KL928_004293 [Ogataea angusta]KAG7844446.1 hypothetical protein KL941_003822 [Ogataea angusta]